MGTQVVRHVLKFWHSACGFWAVSGIEIFCLEIFHHGYSLLCVLSLTSLSQSNTVGATVLALLSLQSTVRVSPSGFTVRFSLSVFLCQGFSVRLSLSGFQHQAVSVRLSLSGFQCQAFSVRFPVSGFHCQAVTVRLSVGQETVSGFGHLYPLAPLYWLNSKPLNNEVNHW